jgi:two-component system, cell cycle response regulator
VAKALAHLALARSVGTIAALAMGHNMVSGILGELEGHADRPGDASQAVPDVVPLDVLVVDDDAHARIALCTAIARLGHHCRGAATGIEALAAHAEQRADVIVSDWTMPGIDGMELCRRARASDAGTYTYLLFVSGHARKRDFVEAVRAGADDYLPKPIDLDDLEARLIGAARIVRAYRRLAQSNVVLHHDSEVSFRAARVDPLTQVANRLQLEEDIEALQSKLSRYGRPAAVAMCDLDGFKRYNDRFGHPAGDDALRRVAQAIRSTLRRADQVYRYGGEEFLTVLHEQSMVAAVAAMERVRAAIEGLAIEHAPGSRFPFLTVSVGVASLDPAGGPSVQEAIARADGALYRVKGGGGNGVFGSTANG